MNFKLYQKKNPKSGLTSGKGGKTKSLRSCCEALNSIEFRVGTDFYECKEYATWQQTGTGVVF